MSLFLASGERRVLGADLPRPSLELAAAAAVRYGIENVGFLETDLRQPGLRKGTFDVVIASGVLHHTPDPRRSFRALSTLVRPGGILVVGLYNAYARLPLRLRRGLARLTGFRLIPFDPVLSDRKSEPARREAWLRDQYQHVLEHRHTLGEVRRWFAENGVEYLRTFPSALLGGEGDDLFAQAPDDWGLEDLLAQWGWMWSLGHEGGLFVTIGARPA
jgi:SAM-dependent methyltransferase